VQWRSMSLQTVRPSYALRMAGLVMATACLGSVLDCLRRLLLLWQDPANLLSPTLRLKTLARFAHDSQEIRNLHAAFIPARHPRVSAARLSSGLQLALDQLAADYLLAAQLT
jgi:hypothetical protein